MPCECGAQGLRVVRSFTVRNPVGIKSTVGADPGGNRPELSRARHRLCAGTGVGAGPPIPGLCRSDPCCVVWDRPSSAAGVPGCGSPG